MKKLSIILFISGVTLLSSCTEQPHTTEITDNKMGTGSVVSEEELRTFIFNPTYASPEYYKKVKIAVQSVQYQVIREQAIKEKNAEVCALLTTESQQKECGNNYYSTLAQSVGDMTMCDKITGSDSLILNCKNRILSTQAVSQKKIDPCEKILQDEGMKSSCRDNIYNLLAVDKKDISLCEKIENNSRKNGCEAQVNKMINSVQANTNKNG